MTTETWLGANGSYTSGSQWSPNVVPSSGDTGIINSGTVNVDSLTFSNVTINLNGTTSAAGTLALTSDTVDQASTLNVNAMDTSGTASAPTVTLTGTTVNNGTVNFVGTTSIVTFATNALLVNAGTINVTGASLRVQTANSSTPGAITNNGFIQVTNPSNTNQAAIINATIGGTGTISIGNAGALSLRQSVSSGQTVSFTGGINAGSALELDSPNAFAATVKGFVSGDRFTLTNIPYTSFTYATTSSSGGTLTLLSGSTVESTINFSGQYTQASFTVSPSASNGPSNVVITTSVTNPATGVTTSGSGTPSQPVVGPVYRFFDSIYGTHFFTADANEKNIVIATRTDLTEETNGFGDVAQSDPNATAVYRFFDTVRGTHFFTASSAERDTILATRADLTYEPGSTFYEHAALQSGDVPVYRFFDTAYGTHFYTGSTPEYQGLTTPGSPSFRANLTYEGVGFYAPSGTFA